MTATAADAEIASSFYRLASSGQIEEAHKLLHEDLVLREPTCVPVGGDFHGVAGLVAFATRPAELYDMELIKPVECFPAGDRVVSLVLQRITSKATRRTIDMEIVELLTVTNGQIVDITVFYRDPGAVVALG